MVDRLHERNKCIAPARRLAKMQRPSEEDLEEYRAAEAHYNCHTRYQWQELYEGEEDTEWTQDDQPEGPKGRQSTGIRIVR